ncbi:MAG: cobalamin-dependent protein [Planctomycetes bacterium]|nr:cobalamin-dependent protein [Planctomycetota bacterium]
MRVLIVAANNEHKPDPVVPLGAAFIAAAARDAGHDVRLFDACFQNDPITALRDELRSFRPQVVGLSIRNIDDVCWPQAHSYLSYYRDLVRTIREADQRPVLVLGGSAFTLMPDQFLRELQPDHGIAGEGELAFTQLLHGLSQGESAPRLLRGRGENFTTQPALDLVDLPEYYQRGGALNVQTRRGCGFSCSYCSYPLLEGRQSRVMAVKDIVDGLEAGLRLGGARHFFVVDNTFNHPPAHAFSFCDELIARRIDVSWTAYVSPGALAPGLLERMAEAGCSSVEFGTDAAANPTLRALGKSFQAHAIIDASSQARAAGLKFAHSLILGGPDETLYTLRQTVEVIEQTNPDAVFAMLGVRLYPGTPLAQRAEREGLIAEREIGIDPVFYVSEAVEQDLENYAEALRERHPNWYFPGLEGDRWVRFWRRRRSHGVRGPLWEWMSDQTPTQRQGAGP